MKNIYYIGILNNVLSILFFSIIYCALSYVDLYPDRYPYKIILTTLISTIIINSIINCIYFKSKDLIRIIPFNILLSIAKVFYFINLYEVITKNTSTYNLYFIDNLIGIISILYAFSIISTNKINTLKRYGVVILILFILQEIAIRTNFFIITLILSYIILFIDNLIFIHFYNIEINSNKEKDNNQVLV